MIDDTNKTMKELVAEYIVDEKENLINLNTILIKIKNNKAEFTNLIHALEHYLVNTNDIFRKKATRLISLTLERVSNLKLNEKELKKMLEFNFSKIKDVVCTPNAIRSIYCKLFSNFV